MNLTALKDRMINYTPILWAVFVSIFVNTVVTVEWSHPYCNVQDSGPAHAAFGFPLPYTQWGGVSSMEYFFMPHIYVLNLTLIGFLTFAIIRKLISYNMLSSSLVLYIGLSVVGVVLASSMVFVEILKLFSIYAVFVPTIGDEIYGSPYFSYRPVGIDNIHYDCKPSEYWFGPIKN